LLGRCFHFQLPQLEPVLQTWYLLHVLLRGRFKSAITGIREGAKVGTAFSLIATWLSIVALVGQLLSLSYTGVLAALVDSYRAIAHYPLDLIAKYVHISLPVSVKDGIVLYLIVGGSMARAQGKHYAEFHDNTQLGDHARRSLGLPNDKPNYGRKSWRAFLLLFMPSERFRKASIYGWPLRFVDRFVLAYRMIPSPARWLGDIILWPVALFDIVARPNVVTIFGVQYPEDTRTVRMSTKELETDWLAGEKGWEECVYDYDSRWYFLGQLAAVVLASLVAVATNSALMK